jgi:imidazolonepropionase-like amidohydrolase
MPDRTVLIAVSRIRTVGPGARTRIPPGAQVVDGRGRYLIPGLWDMHVHSAASVEREFPLYLALGVTGVRNLHTTVDTGLALTHSIKRRLRGGTLVGPRFLANGPIIDGSVVARNAEEARRAVDSLARGGADFIKLYDYLSRDAFFAAVAAARERGLAVAVHVPYSVSTVEAANAGVSSIEHMRGLEFDCSPLGDSLRAELSEHVAALAAGREKPAELFPVRERTLAAAVATRDEARCARAIGVLRSRGAWVVPTLGWGSNDGGVILGDSARMRFVPPRTRAAWTRLVEEDRRAPEPAWAKRNIAERGNIPLLLRAGVPLLAGTDVGNEFLVAGFALHDDLVQLVATGATPAEALRTATLNPARFLAATDSMGTVQEGKLADLVLLSADPLEDIASTRRIVAVVSNGRYLDRSALDRLLADAEAAANR